MTSSPFSIRLLKLEIGAGEYPRVGYVHNDIVALPDIEYVCPAWEVPLPDGSCEEIIFYEVWEHFRYDEARKALDKFRKLLAPGGLLRFTTPDMDLLCKYWIEKSVPHLKAKPWKEQRDYILGALWGGHCREGMVHQWGWSRETIKEILDEFGFDVLLIENNTWGPYADSFLGQCPGQDQPWTHLNVVAKRR